MNIKEFSDSVVMERAIELLKNPETLIKYVGKLNAKIDESPRLLIGKTLIAKETVLKDGGDLVVFFTCGESYRITNVWFESDNEINVEVFNDFGREHSLSGEFLTSKFTIE